MKLSRQEIESVVRLSGERRYSYFVKKVADRNEVWGLWRDGWAMGVAADGVPTVPLWPCREYAELCRIGDWSGYEPKAIPLAEFLGTFVPQLIRDRVRPSIFDTPTEDAVLVDEAELVEHLRAELAKIEDQ